MKRRRLVQLDVYATIHIRQVGSCSMGNICTIDRLWCACWVTFSGKLSGRILAVKLWVRSIQVNHPLHMRRTFEKSSLWGRNVPILVKVSSVMYTVNQIDKHCVMQPIRYWYNHQMMLFKQAIVWYIACQVTNKSQQFPCTPTSQYPNQLYICFNVCFLTSFENLFLCSCSTSVWLVMVT